MSDNYFTPWVTLIEQAANEQLSPALVICTKLSATEEEGLGTDIITLTRDGYRDLLDDPEIIKHLQFIADAIMERYTKVVNAAYKKITGEDMGDPDIMRRRIDGNIPT